MLITPFCLETQDLRLHVHAMNFTKVAIPLIFFPKRNAYGWQFFHVILIWPFCRIPLFPIL
jgi:hypothetical protein